LKSSDVYDLPYVGLQEMICKCMGLESIVDIPEGMRETPDRVVRMYKEMTKGYRVDVPSLFKVFEEPNANEMVIVRNHRFTSLCEHHLVVFKGTVTVGYIPNGKVIGLSKIARVADAFAHRFQLQERMTKQIADAMVDNLDPLGVGVLVTAQHMCMSARGAKSIDAETVTSAMRGVFLEDEKTRSEFLSLSRYHG
jgi:GTP cyclohydrolase I